MARYDLLQNNMKYFAKLAKENGWAEEEIREVIAATFDEIKDNVLCHRPCDVIDILKKRAMPVIERKRKELEKLQEGRMVMDYEKKYKLKESEDERIRKAIIDFFNEPGRKTYILNGFTVDDIIAWLEKQGVHANFRNKIQIGDKVTRNQDGMLVNLSQLKRVAKPAEQKPAEFTYDENGEPELNPFESALFSAFSDIWQRYLLGKGINVAKEVSEISDELLQAAMEMQKPDKWSKEDEEMFDAIMCSLDEDKLQRVWNLNEDDVRNWLKSFKDRCVPQPKKEWSEKPASDDLDEEIRQQHRCFREIDMLVFEDIARHFAEWQKQEMMKNAVDGKIYETQARSKRKATTTGFVSGFDYKIGEKVKLIIIKED